MKQVEALIHPSTVHAVMKALDRLDVGGVTVTDIAAFETPGFRGSYRGGHYVVGAYPMVRVQVVTTDAYAGPIAWAIATAARTGHPGDGIVSIEVIEEALRIRTGERGIAAVSARVDAADVAQSGIALLQRNGTADRPGMSDSAKVLLTNVAVSTVVLVLVFHAPVAYAGLGAGGAGLLLWARERRARRTR